MKLKKKKNDHDHDKCITTPEFNKLRATNFAARLAEANLASKVIWLIVKIVKKTNFDDKLKNLNKKITSNKTRDLERKTKLDDLEKKVKVISTKGLTQGLINKINFLNGSKYFSFDGLQNYLLYDLIRRNLIPSDLLKLRQMAIIKLLHGNLQECREKKIINPYESGSNFSPEYDSTYGIVTFKGICLK